MLAAEEPKACKACAKAKRKCDKQVPSCQRCKEKGITCAYPHRKLSSFVVLEHEDTTLAVGQTSSPERRDTLPHSTPIIQANEVQENGDSSTLDLTISLPQSSSVWFLSPETWKIDYRPVLPSSAKSLFPTSTMKRFLRGIQLWFKTWADTGSNPFIHARLYRFRFPADAQNAYATLCSYLHRTEANEDITLRIFQDQVNRLLLSENSLTIDSSNDKNPTKKPLDVLEHLSRVHALMVYQVIGLFDGDVRARYLAESCIRILERWANEMMDCARQSLCQPASTIDPLDQIDVSLISPTEALWHVWILAETARRTWQMAKGMGTLYLIIKHGWAHCPGGTMFTTRQGAWDADTAVEWERLCSEVDVGLLGRFASVKLFMEASPTDVDEYGQMILETTFGTERMERWKLGIDK